MQSARALSLAPLTQETGASGPPTQREPSRPLSLYREPAARPLVVSAAAARGPPDTHTPSRARPRLPPLCAASGSAPSFSACFLWWCYFCFGFILLLPPLLQSAQHAPVCVRAAEQQMIMMVMLMMMTRDLLFI